MILWLALFLLVMGISFVLAFASMRDFQEIPIKSKEEYGLYLIRNTSGLKPSLFGTIRDHLSGGLTISIERLFKGAKSALVIFGPKRILEQFSSLLDLLELEDYSQDLESTQVLAWEIGTKSKDPQMVSIKGVFKKFPRLNEEEQFLWQVVLGARGAGKELFRSQIRAAVYSRDGARRAELAPFFENLSDELIKMPKLYTEDQMISFYRLRVLGKDGPHLTSEKILNLIRI